MSIKGIHMTNASFSIRLAIALAAGLAFSAVSGHAQSASATISYTTAGANWDYTVTLFDSGTTDLRSFWYGWTDTGNNLPSNPSSPGNSVGWANTLDGNSIMWGNSSSTPLTPGQSATFTFVSSSSPTAMTTGGAGASVAYVNGIDFSQGIAGDSTGAFSPTLVVPEPSSVALLAVGVVILGFGLRSRLPLNQMARVLKR
ncbi:MAG TPA: PEP-CTERM sorting domain-containing protein [Candidatus Acidoferrales bacterium]|nr:PEP-CTERM sorting domain-containing protein [Candidatus Acidoferrales bacterium]